MTTIPTLFAVGLPVVWPALDVSLGKDYYNEFNTFGSVGVTTTGNTLSITIANPAGAHPSPWAGIPRGALLTPSTALIRFVNSGEDITEIDVEPTPKAKADSLVIRPLWAGKASPSLLFLDRDVPPADWPTVIVLSNVDANSYRVAAQQRADRFTHVGVLRTILRGSGDTGDLKQLTPDELRDKYVNRAMDGNLTRLVRPWKRIGCVSGTLDIQTYRKAEDPTDSGYTSPSDMVMEFYERADPVSRFLYSHHPLIEAIRGATTTPITMVPTHTIRENTTGQFVGLPSTGVDIALWRRKRDLDDLVFKMEEVVPIVPGGISYNLYPGDKIHYRYTFTSATTIGNRTFAANEYVRTPEHRVAAFPFFNGNTVTKTYCAAYSFYTRYADFIHEISENPDLESFVADRGNAEKTLDLTGTELMEFFLQSQRKLLETLYRAEARYTRDTRPNRSFTVFVEGDSWTHYPLAFGDIYRHLRRKLRAALQNDCALNLFPLQHFGDRANQMIGPFTRQPDQWTLTQDLLQEYGPFIDLVFCSMGGNDLAEPGISNSYNSKPQDQPASFLTSYYTKDAGDGGYFDVDKIDQSLDVVHIGSDPLNPLWIDFVKRGLEGSFASLLKNHPWRRHLTGKSDGATQSLDTLIDQAALELDVDKDSSFTKLSGTSLAVDKTPCYRIAHDDGFDFATLAQQVKAEIADIARYEARLGISDPPPPTPGVFQYWITFLDATKNARRPGGIPVFAHSYCYPLFRQNPAVLLFPGKNDGGWKVLTGPWFVNRFREAADAAGNNTLGFALVKVLFLKAVIDDYWTRVLDVLQNTAGYDFHPVDVRRLNTHRLLWRDEMHTRGKGFENTASEIFKEIHARFKDPKHPDPRFL